MTLTSANATTLRWARTPPRSLPKRVCIHWAPVRTFERLSHVLRNIMRKIWLNVGQTQGSRETFKAEKEDHKEEPHRAADVEHPRGVRDAEHVPGQRPAAEEVAVQVLGPPARDPEADGDDEDKITDDNAYIEGVQLHGVAESGRRWGRCSLGPRRDA